jgi:acetyl-CoA carboxylase biotin carboxyl carrier protein
MASEIKAETVANVLVHEGEAIIDGDTVVLLESTQTDIPVRTEHAGTVTKLAGHQDDVVRAGDLIAVVE